MGSPLSPAPGPNTGKVSVVLVTKNDPLFIFSVIRGLNSSQSKNAKRSVSSSSKASKRCGGTQHGGVNPCGGGCLRSISDYSIAGVATLRARDFDCSARSPCFDGRGWCQKLTRNFDLIAQDGDRAVSKTLEVPVACICASFAAK